MTISEYRKLKKKKPPRYRNKPTVVDGIKFDSKKEAARYTELQLMLRAGMIADLKIHHEFELKINGVKICSYFADFHYYDKLHGKWVIEDTKSHITRKKDAYRLKNKMVKAILGIEILET